jgi:uncharacterized membrane protein
MQTWILSKWDDLRSSFWFIPLVMTVGAVVLSLIALEVDKAALKEGVNFNLAWTFSRGPEGSRALLATVAGSMITIASVCFSITVVALQQASSQFGPRLLHNFMRDRGNQIVLGTFIASFTYSLLILRAVNGTEDNPFVPHFAVTVGILSALAGVGVLIFFIHHTAKSMQAEHVIAEVSSDLDDALDRLFPAGVGKGAVDLDGPPAGPPPDFDAEATPVLAEESDYLQAIDTDRLMRVAQERDLVLRIDRRPGQFVTAGNPLLRAWPPGRLSDEAASSLRGAFFLADRRTLFQDVEFAVDQLVEVAVRALSPGINDPFTAMACLDRLGAALCKLAGKKLPAGRRYDDKGNLRIVADPVTYSGVVNAAFHQIRQAARGNTAVTMRLLETITCVLPRAVSPEMRETLLGHATVIHRGAQDALPDPGDRAAVTGRYEEALAAAMKVAG